jgi:hypothetical protein
MIDIYRDAGAPIPKGHERSALELMAAMAPDQQARLPDRLPNYAKWALWSGKWPNPAKTKSLLNVLRDGDWDVEVIARKLPTPDTGLSKNQAVIRAQEEKFLRGAG